jgi:DNA-binding NarL/FixJ family response regulator
LLVDGAQPELPSSGVDLILLDYTLGVVSSRDLAKKLKAHFPAAPIIVLSDMQWMPQDIAPYAYTFVRKGEPEQLLATIAEAIGNRAQGD